MASPDRIIMGRDVCRLPSGAQLSVSHRRGAAPASFLGFANNKHHHHAAETRTRERGIETRVVKQTADRPTDGRVVVGQAAHNRRIDRRTAVGRTIEDRRLGLRPLGPSRRRMEVWSGVNTIKAGRSAGAAGVRGPDQGRNPRTAWRPARSTQCHSADGCCALRSQMYRSISVVPVRRRSVCILGCQHGARLMSVLCNQFVSQGSRGR